MLIDLTAILTQNGVYSQKLSQFQSKMVSFGLSTSSLRNITSN
jgi:hypothetical protein